MGIAVAAEMKNGLARTVCARLALDPDLADAAANLVGVVVRRLGQRLQRAAELDDIAVAVLPIIEEGEVVAYGVNRVQDVLADSLANSANEAAYSERVARSASLFILASEPAAPARAEPGRDR